MPSIVLVRHGQASFGAADYDGLSPCGQAQAACVAAELVRQAPVVTRLLTGSLARQRGTAAAISASLALAPEVDARWNEYDSDDILTHHSSSLARLHRAPDSTVAELSPRDFQAVAGQALLAWIAAGERTPCDESWPAFRARVTAALGETGGRLQSGQSAVVCTSAGVISALGVELLGVAPEAFARFNRVSVNAGITRVIYGRSGATLLSFNEHSHLLGGKAASVTYL